jgi:hypothetical protein
MVSLTAVVFWFSFTAGQAFYHYSRHGPYVFGIDRKF